METNKNNTDEKEYTLQDVKTDITKEVEKQETGQRIQLIVFKLGTEEYGIYIEQIKEVVQTPKIARVPQTANYIKGVANIRGNIIAIIDMEEKFTLKTNSMAETSGNYTLVLESEQYKIGILANEVPDTLAVYTTDIDTTANFMQYTSLDESSITGIVKSGDRMIILIDILKMIEKENIYTTITKAIQ